MEHDCPTLRGDSIRGLTLGLDDWRSIYRVLNESNDNHSTLREIETQCRGQADTATVELTQASAWMMSAEVRKVHPEIADRVALQLGMVDLW